MRGLLAAWACTSRQWRKFSALHSGCRAGLCLASPTALWKRHEGVHSQTTQALRNTCNDKLHATVARRAASRQPCAPVQYVSQESIAPSMGTTTASGRPSAAFSWLQTSTAIVDLPEPGTPASATMSLAARVHLSQSFVRHTGRCSALHHTARHCLPACTAFSWAAKNCYGAFFPLNAPYIGEVAHFLSKREHVFRTSSCCQVPKTLLVLSAGAFPPAACTPPPCKLRAAVAGCPYKKMKGMVF